MNQKEQIRQELKQFLNVRWVLKNKDKQLSLLEQEKQQLSKIITKLQKSFERSDLLVEKYGIDLAPYEDALFEIIEDTLSLKYNVAQVNLLKAFLTPTADIEEEHETYITVTLEDKKKGVQKYTIKTFDDLWKLIQKLK